jgi:hypothetical protein
MRRILLTATAAVVLLVVAPAAGAQPAPLPVGEAKGVRIVREHGALVVVFTQRAERLWRRVAGKRVSVLCDELPKPDGTGFLVSQGGGATFRAPKRGRRLHTGDLTRGMDLCKVWLEARTVRRDGSRRRLPRELIVTVPLTQRGAVHLDEQSRAFALLGILTLAALLPGEDANRFATPAELVARLPAWSRPVRVTVVALASPSDTPPAGSIGYYSDGAKHAAAVVLSAGGRRLFLEFDADDVIRSNVVGYIYGDE